MDSNLLVHANLISENRYWYYAIKLGTKFRTFMYAAVYFKSIQLRNLGKFSVGELVNLSSNDSQRLFGTYRVKSLIWE